MNTTEQVSELVFLSTENETNIRDCHYDFCGKD